MKSGATQRILSGVVAIAIAATLTVPAMAADTISFDDIGSHWAKDSIMLCLQHGAISGIRDADENGVSTFKPNDNVTLGQFLAVITRLVAPDKIQGDASAHWAVPNYNAAVQSGIIKSSDFASTKEALNQNLSRQDMAYILVGAAKVNNETLEILPNVESMMGDYNTINYTRQDAVKRAYSNGLLAGDTNGNFKPTDSMTRGQMATVVCRLMEYAPRGTVTVDNNQGTQTGDTIMGGYVSNDGETAGMLMPEYSRQYELEALGSIRTGEDSKGVYVTFTAPTLPTDIQNNFTFEFTADVNKSNGDYFADRVRVNLKPGESKTVYFVSFEDTGVKSFQIDEMSIGVMINNSENKYMFVRSIYSSAKSTAYGTWYDGEKETTSFDSSAVWSGIGK